MKFSLSTGTLYVYPLRTIFRLARSTGFDGVEVVVNPEVIARGGRRIRQIADEEQIGIFSVHPTLAPIPRWRERRDGIGPTIHLAEEIGADMVVMHTPRSKSLDEKAGLAFRQGIEHWQKRLDRNGLRLAVENKATRHEEDRQYALTPLDRLRAFADRHDLGLVLDTTHAGTSGEDLLRARQLFGERLANVHLSDVGGWGFLAFAPTVRAQLAQHLNPGDGSLPLAGLLADLAGSGYVGPVTLEVTPLAARAWWPPAVRRRLADTVRWMRQMTRKE